MKCKGNDRSLFLKTIALLLIIVTFVVVNIVINGINEKKYGEYEDGSEFVQTIDCTPYFANDTYKKYNINFDLRADSTGPVLVYIYDSQGFRYWFEGQTVEATTEFVHYELECEPQLVNDNYNTSMLSFHGGYGTRVYPHIKNIRIEPKLPDLVLNQRLTCNS